MIAAIVFAAVCLQPTNESTCVPEEVLSKVGSQLLQRVSPDSREIEQAAFLTKNGDGSIACRLWPLTSERTASTYRGTIPADTLAIIHTHPHDWFNPSSGDSALSAKLSMPVFVVTNRWISFVDPAGQKTRWMRFVDRNVSAPVCEPIQ